MKQQEEQSKSQRERIDSLIEESDEVKNDINNNSVKIIQLLTQLDTVTREKDGLLIRLKEMEDDKNGLA